MSIGVKRFKTNFLSARTKKQLHARLMLTKYCSHWILLASSLCQPENWSNHLRILYSMYSINCVFKLEFVYRLWIILLETLKQSRPRQNLKRGSEHRKRTQLRYATYVHDHYFTMYLLNFFAAEIVIELMVFASNWGPLKIFGLSSRGQLSISKALSLNPRNQSRHVASLRTEQKDYLEQFQTFSHN